MTKDYHSYIMPDGRSFHDLLETQKNGRELVGLPYE